MMGFYGKLKDTTKAVPSFTTAGLSPMPHIYEILIQLDRKEGQTAKAKLLQKRKGDVGLLTACQGPQVSNCKDSTGDHMVQTRFVQPNESWMNPTQIRD